MFKAQGGAETLVLKIVPVRGGKSTWRSDTDATAKPNSLDNVLQSNETLQTYAAARENNGTV